MTGSRLAAGQDLILQGTQALAGRDMTLAAGRDLTIHAAQSTAGSQSSGGSVSASLGLQAGAGTSNYSLGLSGKLGVSGTQAQGDARIYSNAKIVAGEKLTTVSGQDTTVAGANLTAKDVDMYVGRDLTVASLQDSSSASSSSYGVGGGFIKGKQTNWLGDGNPAFPTTGALVNAGATLAGGNNFDQAAGMILGGVTAATDMKTPPKTHPFENYNANLSGSVAESQSHTVGEQTSILGSESVNIYTEGNTHVAGAIIAALNDNLKLDTGTLSYENLIGKTTSTSTSAGIDWKYSPAQQGDKGKKEAGGGGSEAGKTDPQPGQSGIASGTKTEEQKTAEQKRIEEEKKRKEAAQKEKYKNLPEWMGSLFATSDQISGQWNDLQKTIMVSPGKFAHTEKETTQTAYATIGKGEIIVRNNPAQSLDGLNRDPSQAMKTEQTRDVSIDWKPAFSYVNDALSGWGWPANITGAFNFFTDPKDFLNKLQDKIAEGIPFLKRPIPKKEPVTAGKDAQLPSASSSNMPQTAVQH